MPFSQHSKSLLKYFLQSTLPAIFDFLVDDKRNSWTIDPHHISIDFKFQVFFLSGSLKRLLWGLSENWETMAGRQVWPVMFAQEAKCLRLFWTLVLLQEFYLIWIFMTHKFGVVFLSETIMNADDPCSFLKHHIKLLMNIN